MPSVPSIQDVLQHLNGFVISEMRRLGERCEPISQETLEAIREASHLQIAAKISELEYLRSASFRRNQQTEEAIEVSKSFRNVLKDE